MVDQSPSVRAIFERALELASDAERAAFLDNACADQSELRETVEALLKAHADAGSFLAAPAFPNSPPRSGEGCATIDTCPISERPGTVIGPYKLLQQIGEGGMGVVFMAEQTQPLQRTVALKIIKPGMDTRQVIARFEAERQAVAMMDHPNIAKVLDAGTTGGGTGGWGLGTGEENNLGSAPAPSPQSQVPHTGRPYFVMELVKGIAITKYCDEKHLPLRARLELFVQVCQAVQHAHQKGIIHRDIKPNNVLVAEYDNHAVPKVIDFGVAKATAQRLTERTMFTEFGQVLGTMEYMSPEQSKFNQLDIDTRSDIYSLGVLLYELLAGSTPFEGKRLHAAAFDEMLRIIREEEPPKPSTRLSSLSLGERANSHPLPLGEGRGEGVLTLASIAVNRHTEPARLSKDVRGELDWIVMKALEKDRNRRYETASGFAADIERHLHDEPVEAGPPSAAYRLRKFVRRNRGPVTAGLLVAIFLVAGMISFALQSIRIRAEQAQTLGQRVIAERERQRADDRAAEAERQKELMEKEKTRAEKSLYDASIIAAARAIDAGRHDQARQLLNDCPVDRRNWEWGRLLYLCNLDLMTIPAHVGSAQTAAFSPNGALIASGGQDKLVKIFSAEAGEELRQLIGHGEKVNALAFSPSGTMLATASGSDKNSTDNSVRLWNPTTGELLGTLLGHSEMVCSLAFSPDGHRLASAGADHQIILWDVPQRREERRLQGHKGPVLGLAFHPDGDLLASTGWIPESLVNVWNVRDGTLIKVLSCGKWGIACVTFNHDGAVLAAAGKDGSIYRWKTTDFSSMKSLSGPIFMSSLAYHPKRDEIAISCRDAAFIVSGTQKDNEFLRTFEGPQGQAWSMGYDRDGKRVVVAFADGTLRVFDANLMDASSISMHAAIQGVWPHVTSLAVSSDGTTVAAAIFEDVYARIWDGSSGSERLNLGPHPAAVSSVVLTPDAAQLVTMSDRPRLWDLKARTCSSFIDASENDRYCAALDGEGKLLITGAVNGEVKLWSMQTRKPIRILRGKRGQVTRVAVNPSGTVAATAESNTVVLWDTATGDPLRDLGPEAHNVRGLAFSPDGKLLATGSDEVTPKLWEVASGRLLGKCIGHSDRTWTVAFSPDGRRLATGSTDGTVRVWDVNSRRELLSVDGQARLYSVAFSGDGRFLLGGGYNAGAHIVVWPTLPWSAATYPAESAARDAAMEIQKRKYWRSYEAARDATTVPISVPIDGRNQLASALNEQAWTLATEPDPAKRDPDRAVKLATEAVELDPKVADWWNTLGVAQYRAGNWKEAITALQKFRELRTNDAEWSNPFFLAMSHRQLGNKDEAVQWYNRAVDWMERKEAKSEMMLRSRAEAAELLGINESQSPPVAKIDESHDQESTNQSPASPSTNDD